MLNRYLWSQIKKILEKSMGPMNYAQKCFYFHVTILYAGK